MNTDIVQVIRAYGIELKRAGREYIGLCPFHSEKTPSFHVNAHKGVFHCFGCGEGGDTAAFIMKYTGCDFKTAVSVLKNDFKLRICFRQIPVMYRHIRSMILPCCFYFQFLRNIYFPCVLYGLLFGFWSGIQLSASQ